MSNSSSILYLHVGMHKTGTTFLQLTLARNRHRLLKHGVNYPKIQSSYRESGAHLSLVESIELGNIDSATNLVSKSFKKADRVLLSSERWTPSLRRFPDRFIQWFTDIQQRGHEIRVILYIRRQDLYALSNYRACVRNPLFDRSSLTYQEFIMQRARHFNYLNTLRLWQQVIGKENLYVRPFERTQWHSGDLLSDFLSLLNIKNTTSFSTLPTNTNRSFSAVVTELLRRTNRQRDAGQQQELLKLLNKTLPDTILFDHSRGHPYMTPLEQKEFLGQYADSNRKIATEWLGRPDGRLFYDEIEVTTVRQVADISDQAVKDLHSLIMDRLGNASRLNRYRVDDAIRLGLFQ